MDEERITRTRGRIQVAGARGLIAMAIVAVAAATMGPGPAGAQPESGDRQAISFTFDQERPDRPSAVRLKIDYVNPADSDAKPFAVQTVLEKLARGARIDTSVPDRCTASDAELMVQGEAACPPGSRVGGGEVDFDTGILGPGRIVENDVTQLNNEDELILLFEPEGGGGARAVSRAPIDDGRKITAEVPPIPGGPPDGFTAIKRVRLTLDRISVGEGTGRRSYVTTPATCPTDREWANTIRFTYRDGVTQTERSSSSCERRAGRSCRGREATIEGTAGGDHIRGTSDRDVIAAGSGSDRVEGRGGRGRDSLHGGGGDDVLRGGPKPDACGGGRGEDELTSCAR